MDLEAAKARAHDQEEALKSKVRSSGAFYWEGYSVNLSTVDFSTDYRP